ncbi:MAG: DUF2207 domain-containing protein [Dethiosulfatibacter sp.]|nr:DUF2207 domain-containing protein [Dethiosulfatibacter sp.]
MFLKNKTHLLVFGFVFFMLLLFTSKEGYATKSMDINKVAITAEVLKDGTMLIQEERTIVFQGQHNGFFQNLRMDPGVSITDVAVSENGVNYTYNPGYDYGPVGTYLTRTEPNNIHVDWSIDAFNQTRTFLLTYKVHNQIKLHNDVGELYYKFVGDETEIPQSNVSVRLMLPDGSKKEDLRAWGHGPLDGNVSLVGEREVIWEINTLPPRTFLEGRVTFTPEIIDNDSLQTGQSSLQDILKEEQKLADQANFKRSLARLDWIFAAFSLIISVIIAISIRRRFAKPYDTQFKGDYYRELPEDYSPGELGVLIRKGRPIPLDFTATVIDLAQRGYVRLDEFVPEKRFGDFFRRRKSDKSFMATRLEKTENLRPHEKSLLDFLFNEVSLDNKQVSFDEIETFAKKKPTSFKGFWSMWIEYLQTTSLKHKFFDDSNNRGIITGVLAGTLFFIIGIVLLMFFSIKATGIFMIVSSLILFGSSVTIHRRSPKGEEDYVRWMAFKKFLLHFSEMERHELPSLIIWEHYMVYAITLGVAKEVMKQLQVVYPDMTEGNRQFGYGWYYYGMASSNSMSSLGNSFDSLTSSISNSITTALSSTSSGSGGGGGFSGGGGGGGGGGGVGSR